MPLLFLSCEFSAGTHSFCNGNYDDISGFTGNYFWEIEGRSAPVIVTRRSRGEYFMVLSSKEAIAYRTCKVGRNIIAESPIQGSTNIQLVKLDFNNSGVDIRSILFDKKLLNTSGISYTYEASNVQGTEISILLVENEFVNTGDLLKYEMVTPDRDAYQLVLKRR